MSYKSLLTYADSGAASERRLATSIELARQFDAHLTIAAFGYDPDIPPYAFDEGAGAELAEIYQQSRKRAGELATEAGALITREGIKGEALPLTSTYSGLPRTFGALARFSDLVVLTQPSLSGSDQAAVNLIEGALFDGDAPVLVCPEGEPKMPPETVVIGWNGDREALRAVRWAIPLLRTAGRVEIGVIDPTGFEGEPGADLAVLLARHGIAVEITTHALAGHRTSEVLRQHLTDVGADLLIMGAYGHSRFREYVIGGVTREILEDAAISTKAITTQLITVP